MQEGNQWGCGREWENEGVRMKVSVRMSEYENMSRGASGRVRSVSGGI